MGLKWQDVNLKDGFLILHETKNGERRRVPLSGLGLDHCYKNMPRLGDLDTPLLFPGIINPNKPIDLQQAFRRRP